MFQSIKKFLKSYININDTTVDVTIIIFTIVLLFTIILVSYFMFIRNTDIPQNMLHLFQIVWGIIGSAHVGNGFINYYNNKNGNMNVNNSTNSNTNILSNNTEHNNNNKIQDGPQGLIDLGDGKIKFNTNDLLQ